MKTFEIWNQQSNGYGNQMALHILKAAKVSFKEGHYLFMSEEGRILHAIQSAPNLLIRTADEE